MARFGEINAQYFDDSGAPLGSGKLYFYESGTTTPKNTFSDINLTIPNTNPVILTAAGRQPNIFFNGNAKGILADKNDVQILVRDPVGETGTNFGDAWVATTIYSANSVVIGSDGVYYRSLANGNQNNNPTTTSGFWTLLYSVDWNAGITYKVGAVVTYEGNTYQSLQNGNINQNPASVTAYWAPLAFAWLATRTYAIHENVVGTDGILYTSLQNSNLNKVPASSSSYWVGTSAAAAASATAAAASATAAASSATAAATSATASATSATASATSATASDTARAASVVAKDAAVVAKDAAVVAKTAAETAETNAETAETNAASSATAAASSASGASGSATAAASSATAAASSATAASSSQTAAASSATAAAASATTATTKASEAATSATNAATSASTATTKASEAATSATNAATSATAAAGSATSAATSATAAATTYDNFDDRYLGDKSSDPTVDNDGNALLTGALYFNTASNAMKVYTGSAWAAVAPTATSVTVSQISDYNGTAAELNYTDGVTSPIQTQLDAKAVYPSQSGNAGKFLSTDGTDPLWGDVSASPTLEAVASGTLANGDTVVINADGTVSAAGLVVTPVPVIGSKVEFEAGNTSYISSCYDTGSNKVIIAYRDGNDSNRVKAIVGTVASGAITFGTPANIDGNTGSFTSIAYDANANKVVVIYHKNTTNDGVAQVGTVSGTSISFGSENVFSSTEISYNAIRYDSSANKLIIAWYSPNDTAIKVTAGTISGTNMSFGAVASTAAPSSISIGLVYDANANKSLLCYRGPSNYGYAAVISLSGTTASIGTPAAFISETVSDVNAVHDSSNNKTLIVWRKASNNYGAGIVATISGTSVTFGTEAVIASETGFYFGASFDTTVNKSIVAYYNSSSGYSKSVQGTISGTGVTFTSPVTYLTASTDDNALVYDPDSERTIFAFDDTGNSNKGTSLLYASTTLATNLTSENYIGISAAAYSNGANATIQLVGTVDDAQSSLTAGQSYFVQENGSIALTPDTTPVFAGTAISATKLLIGERDAYPNQTGNSGKFLTTNGTAPSWGAIALNTPLGAIDAGGLCLTNTNGTALISLSGASLASNNPQGYAGLGIQNGSGTNTTAPRAAKYSTYYKRWFATGEGYNGNTSANDLSLWTSVDGITWAVVTSLRFLYAATWQGDYTSGNSYDPPFAIDESNGRIWVGGRGTTSQIRLAYFDPNSGNNEGTTVNISISSGSDDTQVYWIECLEPANDIYIVAANNNFTPRFARIAAGATSGSNLGNGSNASERNENWRFCYNYNAATSTYRIAMMVGDSRQIYWREATSTAGALSGPVTGAGSTSYNKDNQIMMSNTHLMWTSGTTIYYKSFDQDSWRSTTDNWTTNNALSYSTKAMNYNPVDGNTYAITQRGQVHKFTDPASVSCIGTIGQGVADSGFARIKFRST